MAGVRVLFLEDDRADFELITEILRQDGFVLEAHRAGSQGEFEQSFSSRDFDLVLSDYSVPGYSGFAALKYVRARDATLPFILISGALSEEQAVEGLKAGATDYIIKQRLHRLGPAVQRALDAAAERRELQRTEAQLREVEAQLLRAERIQTIGSLSGGIAHDLNNGLAPIVMAAEILSDEVHTESGRRMLEMVRTSAKRCADMVKQILSFTRGAGHGREPLNPAELIEELAGFARETFPRLITIHSQSEPGIRWIDGNATQIYQVLMNLLVNARDAIPAGGTIWVTARNVFLRHQKTPMWVEAVTGPYVSITVRDTGTGIPSEVMDKIFEPFFTTKEPDKGTGLGLSTVYSIVKSHGGFLEVRSEPGQGATFEIFLPAHVDTTEAGPAAEIAKRPPAHGERLLLIDDEAGLLAILKNTLETIGFHVSTAESGLEAVSLLEKADAKFDVILTDWIMPILSGPDLIKRIRALAPESRILVVTGSANVEEATVRESGIDGVLLKPYTTETLLAAISAALGNAETMEQV